MIAYCWRSGQIDFGRKVPPGAIGFAEGPAKKLRAAITATARMAYDGETMLVPGIPEAANEKAAGDALKAHCGWLAQSAKRSGIRVSVTDGGAQ